MLAKRIIPCLDVKDGRVVKGTNFQGLRDMADPVEMARFYNESGADELVFYDITASAEGRNLFTDILRRVASEIFIPLTVGGGIRTLDDFDRVLKCGADKVSRQLRRHRGPRLIGAAAKKYGDQCVVLVDGREAGGRAVPPLLPRAAGWTPAWTPWSGPRRGVDDGAGEIVVNSIDTDGVKSGFDLEMLDAAGRTGERAHQSPAAAPGTWRTLPSSSPSRHRSRGWRPPFSTPAGGYQGAEALSAGARRGDAG